VRGRGGDGEVVATHRRGGDMPAVPDHLDSQLLGLYLADHLAGAAGGISRFERLARVWRDRPYGREFAALAEQIGAEAQQLREIIDMLDARPRRHRQVAVKVAEHLARLKVNGRPFARSPMGLLLEVEVLRGAVMGKRGLWQTLADNGADLGLPEEAFRTLVERSEVQVATLDRLHADIRVRAFRSAPPS
jgi:UDP-glucose 4-epimerase